MGIPRPSLVTVASRLTRKRRTSWACSRRIALLPPPPKVNTLSRLHRACWKLLSFMAYDIEIWRVFKSYHAEDLQKHSNIKDLVIFSSVSSVLVNLMFKVLSLKIILGLHLF